jgi:hypothetical protein
LAPLSFVIHGNQEIHGQQPSQNVEYNIVHNGFKITPLNPDFKMLPGLFLSEKDEACTVPFENHRDPWLPAGLLPKDEMGLFSIQLTDKNNTVVMPELLLAQHLQNFLRGPIKNIQVVGWRAFFQMSSLLNQPFKGFDCFRRITYFFYGEVIYDGNEESFLGWIFL